MRDQSFESTDDVPSKGSRSGAERQKKEIAS